MKNITIVIPVRKGEDPYITLESLAMQTYQDFNVVVVYDENQHGANWARNEGFKKVNTEFVLFSDNDIEWLPDGIYNLYTTLCDNHTASYSYGIYECNGKIWCDREFDAEILKKINYISTMSLIRTDHFVGFDEKIVRLQDWDLWLTMMGLGRVGVSCRQKIFTTPYKEDGISYGTIPYEEAFKIVRRKHGIE